MYRELNIIPYCQCDKLLGLAKCLENYQIRRGKLLVKYKMSCKNVRVNDVTDWSYALDEFLVSMLFGVSPGQS